MAPVSINFIEPLLGRKLDKMYYNSCVIDELITITVGDTVAVKLRGIGVEYGRVVTLYMDDAIMTLNTAGSTLLPQKCEILWYFSIEEIPPVISKKLNNNTPHNVRFIPVNKKGAIISGSLETIEIHNIKSSHRIEFPPYNEPLDDSTCYIEAGFDKNGQFYTADDAYKKSFDFARFYIKSIDDKFDVTGFKRRRVSFLKNNFKINDWLSPKKQAMVFDSYTVPSNPAPIPTEYILKSLPEAEVSYPGVPSKQNIPYLIKPPPLVFRSKMGDSVREDSISDIKPRKRNTSSNSSHKETKIAKVETVQITDTPLHPHGGINDILKEYQSNIEVENKDKKKSKITRSHDEDQLVRPLPHRRYEHSTIKTFIQSRVGTKSSGCLYVSGMPGSGKTATVIRACEELSKEGLIKIIYINCTSFTNSKQVLVEIAHRIIGRRLSWKQAMIAMENFSRIKAKKVACLVVDEFDHLCTNQEQVWYNISDWSTRDTNSLIFIAISNTIDLPDRLLEKRISSRLSFQRLIFNPYTFEQLVDIMKFSLNEKFDPDALVLLCRRVAAVSGDVRKCLTLGNLAHELASKKLCTIVSVDVMEEVFRSLVDHQIKGMSSLSPVAGFVIRAISSLTPNSGSNCNIKVTDIHREVSRMSTEGQINSPSLDSILKILNLLRTTGFILLDSEITINSKINVFSTKI